jgi:hypothetical protein
MKPVNHALDRLFRAAAHAPGQGQDHPSPALEAKILTNWRHRSRGEESMVLLSLFRRGVAVAAAVAAVTMLLTLRGDDTQLPAMDSMVLDSVSELSLLP